METRAEIRALIEQARTQVAGLDQRRGGSLRLEAYRIIDTMNEIIRLAEREVA